MLVHCLRKDFVEVIIHHFKQTFGRIVHFERTHEERSSKKGCCTFWQTYLCSFVLASACLQNPCGIRIVLRELASKHFTAVRQLVCSKTMKRCIKTDNARAPMPLLHISLFSVEFNQHIIFIIPFIQFFSNFFFLKTKSLFLGSNSCPFAMLLYMVHKYFLKITEYSEADSQRATAQIFPREHRAGDGER